MEAIGLHVTQARLQEFTQFIPSASTDTSSMQLQAASCGPHFDLLYIKGDQSDNFPG